MGSLAIVMWSIFRRSARWLVRLGMSKSTWVKVSEIVRLLKGLDSLGGGPVRETGQGVSNCSSEEPGIKCGKKRGRNGPMS